MCCPIDSWTNNEKNAASRCELFFIGESRRKERERSEEILSELFREHEQANDVMDDASRVQTPPPRDFSRVCLINAMFTSPQICLISILAVIVEGIYAGRQSRFARRGRLESVCSLTF